MPCKTRQLQYIDADLFTAPCDVPLAHCVSADLLMSAGIAVQFTNAFGDKQAIRNKVTVHGARSIDKLTPGTLLVLPTTSRYIYYLVTKPRAGHKPTYKAIRKSLQLMRKHAETKDIAFIAMPKIACGRDTRNWTMVEAIIKTVFANSSINIVIHAPST